MRNQDKEQYDYHEEHDQTPKKFISKKEERNYNKKLARKYYKAKFDEKIGYRFQARREYNKQLKKQGKGFKITPNMIGILSGVIILLFLVFNIVAFVHIQSYGPKAEHYKEMTRKIAGEQSALQSEVDSQTKKVESYSVSNSAGVNRANNKLNRLFKDMFQYNDGETYEANYKDGLNVFDNPKASYVSDVFSNGKDASGDNKIDALGLSSELKSYDIYSTHENDVDRDVLDLKAVVSYHAYSDDVSGKLTDRTHQNVYSIKFDTKKNKIIDMKKEATLEPYNDDIKASE